MLLLAAARRLGESERILRAGEWHWWGPKLFVGVDVWGKTLGIVGMGRIGQAVARRGRGFGMEILYHNRSRKEDAERSSTPATPTSTSCSKPPTSSPSTRP
jgi:lactate dehydrogenase-like 2-hydroxyacid dehydrogenase